MRASVFRTYCESSQLCARLSLSLLTVLLLRHARRCIEGVRHISLHTAGSVGVDSSTRANAALAVLCRSHSALRRPALLLVRLVSLRGNGVSLSARHRPFAARAPTDG